MWRWIALGVWGATLFPATIEPAFNGWDVLMIISAVFVVAGVFLNPNEKERP